VLLRYTKRARAPSPLVLYISSSAVSGGCSGSILRVLLLATGVLLTCVAFLGSPAVRAGWAVAEGSLPYRYQLFSSAAFFCVGAQHGGAAR